MHAKAAMMTTTDQEQLVLQGVNADVTLSTGSTEITVTQTYRNDESSSIEAVYTFPLPLDAVLLDLDVQLGDRHLKGNILPRVEASEQYEDAVSDGDSAVMLEQLEPGLYTMNVGNLQAGETCVVTYHYASLNRWSNNTLRFCLPSTIAPRYGDPRSSGLEPHQIPEYTMAETQGLSITVRAGGSLADARIACPTHKVRMDKVDGIACVSLVHETAAMDRDFVLELVSQSQVISSAQVVKDLDGWMVHTSFCPSFEGADEQPARALKLLVDCSGSMSGDSIAQAREAVSRIIDSLRSQDYFSVAAFGNHYRNVLNVSGMLPATDENKALARDHIQSLNADMGGTQIGEALATTYAMRCPLKTRADLLLITDGNVWDQEELIANAKASRHRVFTVGVGSSVSEAFVRALAERTAGACELVTPNEDMASKIHRHFLRMWSPRCEDLKMAWSNPPTDAYPNPVRTVYSGDTVHLFHWFNEPPTDKVTVTLELPDFENAIQEISLEQTEESVNEASPVHPLARLAAATMIRETQDEEIGTKLALDYQLMSPWTNCLVIDERPEGEKAKDLPELRKVRSLVSAGWGGMGSVDADVCFNLCMSEPAESNYRQVASMRETVSCARPRENGPTSYDEPAIRRSQRITSDAGSDDSILDIPAFLKRQSEPQYGAPLQPLSRWIGEHYGTPTRAPTVAEIQVGGQLLETLQKLVSQGLDDSLVAITFLYISAKGYEQERVARQHMRLLRKLYREEIGKSGLDAQVVGDMFNEAFEKVAHWKETINLGVHKINSSLLARLTR